MLTAQEPGADLLKVTTSYTDAIFAARKKNEISLPFLASVIGPTIASRSEFPGFLTPRMIIAYLVEAFFFRVATILSVTLIIKVPIFVAHARKNSRHADLFEHLNLQHSLLRIVLQQIWSHYLEIRGISDISVPFLL